MNITKNIDQFKHLRTTKRKQEVDTYKGYLQFYDDKCKYITHTHTHIHTSKLIKNFSKTQNEFNFLLRVFHSINIFPK